ncbi:hypothetical protein ABEB36_008071 [Hypothenemus hampei]|uniref:Uncharacterized protein n=1 Tax=Hypothenemus hampei TaxID=57062 RepID=A0ABD1EKM1_HYPHA
MVKNLQEEAQKSSDQRLLSSPHLTEQPSSANHLVDNLKEVNKYLVNRAQDALDTVGHSHGKQEGDVDSENTKKIITDLKKMPQFLLSKAKTVLNGFDKKISENQRPDEIIGVTHKNEVNTEIPSTTIAFKNKFEKYMDDLKKRRQNQYSPENILKNSQISSRIQNLKEEPSSKSTHSQLLQLPQDLEKRREELKSKLQQVLAKKPLVDNKEWVEVGAKEPAELSTEATIKETSPSSTSTSIFLPTLISTPITKKPDILKKYLENLRSNSVLPSLKQSNPLTSDNQSESTRKVNLFKDKIKNYVDNMKNPLEPKVESRLAEEQEVKTPRKSESEKLKEIFKATLGQDPKPINNEILETVNKPEQVKDEKDFLSLSRASTEKRKEELNNLRNKLLNLAKGQFNKPSSILGSSIGKKNDEGNKEQIVGKPLDINTLLGMENSSKSADNNDIIEWSSNLGQIVQSSSKPQDVFFIGKGIKLPMKISKGEDGVLDFSVDLDKLCSCKNSTCPKNHTAIEQTVSTILEAEAELKDQLSHPEQMENDNEPSLKRSIINKRSTDVTGLMLGLENQQKKIENTLANSINKLQDDTRKVTNQVLNGVNSPSLMKQSVKNTIETQRRKVAQESEKINNAVVNNVKQMERDRIIKKILNQLNYPKLPLDHPESQYLTNNLKQLYKTLQSPEKIIEKANFNLNKLTTTVNPLALFNNQMKKSLTEDILNFQNPIQTGQIDVLENKLQQLDNEVKKYEDKSEKLFIDESKKLLGSHTNKVIDEEVNIISKLLSWISDFSKVEKNEI